MLVFLVFVWGLGILVYLIVDFENVGFDFWLMLYVVYYYVENFIEVGLLVYVLVSYKLFNRKFYFVELCDRVGGNDGCFYLGFFFYWILFCIIFLIMVLLIKSYNNNYDFVIIW